MTRKCVVKNCIHERTDTFHRIPKNTDQRNIWLDLLDLPDTVNGRVCSKHFDQTDFEVKGDGHVWLNKYAYPIQVEDGLSGCINEVEIVEDVSVCDSIQSSVFVHDNGFCPVTSMSKVLFSVLQNFNPDLANFFVKIGHKRSVGRSEHYA